MAANSLFLLCALFGLSSCSGQSSAGAEKELSPTPGDTVASLSNNIWYIFQAANGDHWFGSDGDGVFRYHDRTLTQFTVRDGLGSDRIRGIQEDRHGNIYFSTLEGLNKFDGKVVAKMEPSAFSSPNDWKLQSDDLWFTIPGRNGEKGPYRYDGTNLYRLEFRKHHMEDAFLERSPDMPWSPYEVYTIYKDSKGHMWFGTSNLGVCRFDGRTIDWLYEDHLTQTPEGGSFGIRSIIEDAQGKFWFCNTRYRFSISTDISTESDAALISYERENGITGLTTTAGNDHVYFLSIVEDDQGNLWMATYEQGVWRYNGSEVTHYPVKVGGKDVTLFSIYKDKNAVIWLASPEAGAFRFNGNGFEKFVL